MKRKSVDFEILFHWKNDQYLIQIVFLERISKLAQKFQIEIFQFIEWNLGNF